MKVEHKVDIGIVGAGVTGLMLADKLSALNYSVALIDKSSKLCNGPSTRNEGWLHRGTYHSTSIADSEKAKEVAERCIYGYQAITQDVPECIEDAHLPTYALIKDEARLESTLDRWNASGVLYESVLLRELPNLVPELNHEPIKAAFKVSDVSINTRTLYQKLLSRSIENGAKIFTATELINGHDNIHVLHDLENNQRTQLKSKLLINTTGFGMYDFLKTYNPDLMMRFWKSHLVVLPRLLPNNAFYLDPGEAAAFNHDKYTIVGQHEDAVVADSPNYEVIEDRAQSVREATTRLLPKAAQVKNSYAYACLKPDLSGSPAEARSLGLEIREPDNNIICVLPGKMTESPYVTDAVVQLIQEKGHSPRQGRKRKLHTSSAEISLRPCDELDFESIEEIQTNLPA